MLIVQLRYSKARAFYWSALDQDLANDIYLSNNFASFFFAKRQHQAIPDFKSSQGHVGFTYEAA